MQGENIFAVNFQETESYLWWGKDLSRNKLYMQDNKKSMELQLHVDHRYNQWFLFFLTISFVRQASLLL